ncbi:hypothetical protein LDO26_01380 [Luteimonas sp. BDR2-5]|uniref:hypothetical protein n=1 Tax=Proluteimonas luteida TaxID=2878685 RepID=UPI001E584B4D|nr:hypothetical protein [Luteimonas sp. BDR2-5]MCD9026867.1 hypothetical protein [Luteimonas sp. BDR2-5]
MTIDLRSMFPPAWGLRIKTAALNHSATSPMSLHLSTTPRCARRRRFDHRPAVDVSSGLRPPDQDRCLEPFGHLSDIAASSNHAALRATPAV